MSLSPRPLNSACGEQTRRRFEGFNAKAAELQSERNAIDTDLRKLLDDAYERKDDALRLRFRADALRDRVLQCDLDELALFGELGELETLAHADWRAEAARLRADHDKHLRALDGVAKEMELDEPSEQRTHLVDYDPLLVSQQRAIAHADQMAETPLVEKADQLRMSHIQASILSALT